MGFIKRLPLNDKVNNLEIVEILKNEIELERNFAYRIGVEGDYGIGKSSIILTLKEELSNNPKFTFVDIYPWFFKTSNDFYSYFFSVISKNSDVRTGFDKLSVLLDLGSGNKWINAIKKVIIKNKDYSEIKKKIGNKLARKKRKLVFVFYDLDRSENDVIEKVLSIISNLLNIKNTITIIEYNEKVLCSTENGFDIEKFIDFRVPVIIDDTDLQEEFFQILESKFNISSNNTIMKSSINEYLKRPPISDLLEDYLKTSRKLLMLTTSIIKKANVIDDFFIPDLITLEIMMNTDIEFYYFLINEFKNEFNKIDLNKKERMRVDFISTEIFVENLADFCQIKQINLKRIKLYLSSLFPSYDFYITDNKINSKYNSNLSDRSSIENDEHSISVLLNYYYVLSLKKESSSFFRIDSITNLFQKNTNGSIENFLREEVITLSNPLKYASFWYLLEKKLRVNNSNRTKQIVNAILKIILNIKKVNETFLFDYS